MPNTIITPSVLANAALPTLINNSIFLPLVNRDYSSQFNGKQGDTITVRKPATFTVDEFDRNTGIQLQDVVEDSFTVTLDTIPDVSFPVTAEELTLEVTDFETRFLDPAMQAIATYIDETIAEALADQARSAGHLADGSGTASNRRVPFLQARSILSRARAPMQQRYAALSPEAVAEIGEDDMFFGANTFGSTNFLRDANLGRVQGFETYESQALGYAVGAATRGEVDGLAWHRDAVTFVSRTLSPPMAAQKSAVANFGGLGLRVTYDYDQTYKQDIVSIDMLYGIAGGEDRATHVVELEYGQGS